MNHCRKSQYIVAATARDQFILARTSSSARKVHVLPYTSADLIDRKGVLIAKRREAPRTPAENLRQFSAGVSER
ncbi:hypothetical protein Y032_0010g1179 [Ancylostoma ceylanicum]|uniref:Uncharacterized protein n=1 Tax=Ancylostoma ceylanicum TaxID=53326 RepID=A0A016VFR8_9BILA|nr:hypothetical protein Y032_0010g1179 [Ancylostoma ceylanicum]